MIATVAPAKSKSARMAYPIFAIGLDKLYFMPFGEDEDIHMRCLAIDRYIESNGWTWDSLIEEMAKPDVDLSRN